MADEMMMNGEIYDDPELEITGDDASETSGLNQKVDDLKQENDEIARKNREYKQRIEELKDSVNVLRDGNVELKNKVDEAESENKALGAVAARAAELEAEVARLQHDLVSTMSDLQDSTLELSDLKRGLMGMKDGEKEKDVKLETLQKERNLLVSKVENLEGVESSIRDELERKGKYILDLRKKVDDLESAVGRMKTLETLKNDLEKTVEKMKVEIADLESRVDEKEEVINEFIMRERAVLDDVYGVINGNAAIGVGRKGVIGNLKQKDWVVMAGSTFAAVTVMGVACYMQHAARKQ
ncbi:peroxisomal and mitochondrial division factor 2-like [Primulina huaijiensis]|uniref:peroxisomal and mitochondrial division factor 2-like n=1 Tax=Primulina huaijiensis TaxID=1492673 RepID=UPI003CC768E3